MILTLQCHLIDHISVTEIQRSTRKWGAICQYRGGMGLKSTFVDTRFGSSVKFFLLILNTSLFVIFQTYFDDINITVPLI